MSNKELDLLFFIYQLTLIYWPELAIIFKKHFKPLRIIRQPNSPPLWVSILVIVVLVSIGVWWDNKEDKKNYSLLTQGLSKEELLAEEEEEILQCKKDIQSFFKKTKIEQELWETSFN